MNFNMGSVSLSPARPLLYNPGQARNLNRSIQTDLISLYFAKAFDTVPHSRQRLEALQCRSARFLLRNYQQTASVTNMISQGRLGKQKEKT